MKSPTCHLYFAMLISSFIWLPWTAKAEWDPEVAYATTAAAEPASVLVIPDGSGPPLSSCYRLGGNLIDSTINLSDIVLLAQAMGARCP